MKDIEEVMKDLKDPKVKGNEKYLLDEEDNVAGVLESCLKRYTMTKVNCIR